jgi:heptosyltransferase-2
MNRILIIQTASIGDVILATALLETIHRSFRHSSIDFLLKKGNESLFLDHPYLNQVLIWDKKNKKYKGFRELHKTVRNNHYDLIINVQRFALTGLLTAFSGAGMTIGFDKNPFSRLFTIRVPHVIQQGTHEVTRNHDLAAVLTRGVPGRPVLYPSKADDDRVKTYKTGQYYTVSPASLWFTKQYPAAHWARLISMISSPVYLLGAAADQSLCNSIIDLSGNPFAVNLAGTLSLLESTSLMRDARMNFTNDSAPMHLASAVNAPVTAVYCSTIPGFGFGPLSEQAFIAETPERLSCRPCGLHGLKTCPEKHFRCAHGIPFEELLKRR